VWKECTLAVSDLVAVEWLSHSQPITVHRERDLRRPTLKVDHRHDHVALGEPASEVAELVVGRELRGSSVAPRVLLLA